MKRLALAVTLLIAATGCSAYPAPTPPPAPVVWDQKPANRDPLFTENETAALAAVRNHLSEEPQWFALTTRLSNVGLLNIAYTSCAHDDDIEAKRAVMKMVLPSPEDVPVYEQVRQLSAAALCPEK